MNVLILLIEEKNHLPARVHVVWYLLSQVVLAVHTHLGLALESGCFHILLFFSPFCHHCSSVMQLVGNNLSSFGTFPGSHLLHPAMCLVPGKDGALFYHEWGDEAYSFFPYFLKIYLFLRTVLDLQKKIEKIVEFLLVSH